MVAQKKTKVHIGNGSVYLLGEWSNVDVWESGACLASNEPYRISTWGVHEDNYYGKVSVDENNPTDPRQFVCDVYGSWESLPFESGSIEEILSRQCFEHLSKREAHWGLMEAWRVLRPDGVLRIDVPDHETTLRAYCDAHISGNSDRAVFLLRHLLGSRKNDFAYHMGSWTKEKLIEFCGKRGFALAQEEPNIHFYPAFCLRFTKVPILDMVAQESSMILWSAPWQYCGDVPGTPLTVPEHYKVLEVGPGGESRRWRRADAYVDRDQGVLDSIQSDVEKKVGDVCAIPFPDDSFDYVFCSHCIEHCDDPEKACNEMARVAKGGCIVTPSIGKDVLYNCHEQDHKWMIYHHKGLMYFFEYDNRWRDDISNRDVQSIMHKLLRLGAPQYGPDGALMRSWFRHAEPFLDVVHKWEGAPRMTVCR